MSHYLVTGASGLLGLNFALRACAVHQITGVLHQRQLKQTPFSINFVDMMDIAELDRLFARIKPEVVINCAAMANVDQCEQEPDLADLINTQLPGKLAEMCKQYKARLVHISTDAIFDGKKGDYCEQDQPNPLNKYAKTKLAGEEVVAKILPKALIARVNFFGWSLTGRRSLAEWFYNNLKANLTMNGFTDVFFNPLEVLSLVDILIKMVEKGLNGTYHIASPDGMSKYDFGIHIARQFGFNENLIQPYSWQAAELQASRSPNTSLNIKKLQNDLGDTIPALRENIVQWHQLHQEGYPARLRSYAVLNTQKQPGT